MASSDEKEVIFGRFTGRKADYVPPRSGSILVDFWEPTKVTKIMLCTGEFHDYVGTMHHPVDFLNIYLKPDSLAGHFDPPRLFELLEFCEWFPEYSISSRTRDGTLINHPILGAWNHHLCRHNRNKEKIICHSIESKAVRYTVAGYNISSERPSITPEQFWRDLGMVVGSPEESVSKKRKV